MPGEIEGFQKAIINFANKVNTACNSAGEMIAKVVRTKRDRNTAGRANLDAKINEYKNQKISDLTRSKDLGCRMGGLRWKKLDNLEKAKMEIDQLSPDTPETEKKKALINIEYAFSEFHKWF